MKELKSFHNAYQSQKTVMLIRKIYSHLYQSTICVNFWSIKPSGQSLEGIKSVS